MKLKDILSQYRLQLVFTLFLILLEATTFIFFPLFIGYAINAVIVRNYSGAIQLGLLGLVSLIIGISRRVLDSRFYAKVYENLGTKLLARNGDTSSSIKTARLGMIKELVEFMENSLPELIMSIIGLLGTIIIILTLNINVFYGCFIATLIIFCIYSISKKKTIRLNKSYNDHIEEQVNVVTQNNETVLKKHLKGTMRWNIKLSDLEALNFSFSWIVLMILLVYSIIVSVMGGIASYGTLFSLIMYVFQYMENVMNLPLFYQNWLRLTEIRDRLGNMGT